MKPRSDAGVSLIVAWKLAKGGVLTVLALVLGATFPSGKSVRLAHQAADYLVQNMSSTLLHRFAAWLASHITPLTVGATTLLITLDGALALVQGIGLALRRRWAAWLTVIATSLLIPVELYHLAQHPRVTRVVLLVGNAAIAGYLALRVHRAGEWTAEPQRPSSPAGGAA